MTLPASAGFVVALIIAMSGTASAGETSDAVKPFYDRPGLELEPAERGRFVDPAKTVLDQNDAIKAGGEGDGCLDPALPFDDSDYDPAEVAKTLQLAETVSGGEAKVVATFKVADGTARLEWKLRRAEGAWKVADIVSLTKDWALSQFNCE
jgi:hypothetical protein